MRDAVTRLAALRSVWRLPVLIVLGVFAALGQAPLDLWPATILGLALFLSLHALAASPLRAALDAWAFGLGYFGFALRWIVEPFLVDIARYGWMAPFALVLMAGGGALFWAAAAWVARRVAPGGVLIFGLALVWVELARALIFTGFPWALIGHVWVETPLAQLASFGGPHLLTLVAVLAAWALTRFHRPAGLAVIVVLSALAFALRPGPAPTPAADAPVVRLVQPNAPQHLKWDPAYRQVFMDRMIALTGQGDVPDLVVWPETAVPALLNYQQTDMQPLDEAARGAPLVFGIQRRDDATRYYNSLVVMAPGGRITAVYDKRHLVPFGEYIPGVDLLEKLGFDRLAGMVGTGFTAGDHPGPVRIPGIGTAAPLICYEGIFAEEVSDGPDRPRLLLLITNDAWFGEAAGPYQHLAQARLRAIEQGLPMVRVANTGVTAMIDAHGRLIQRLPLGVSGAIDVALPAALPPTLYARWGELPFGSILILLTIALYLGRQRISD